MSANDPYAGADRRNANRIVALLWLLSGVLTLAYLPLDPPTDAIGDAGWIVAGVMIAFSFAAGVTLLRRTEPVSFDVLLLVSYFGVAQVALLQWLAGGIDAPYQNLYLIWIGSVMGIHPLKRALPFLVIALAVPFGPLLYESQTSSDVESLAANVMLWALLGAVMLALMSAVRAQRLKLAAEEEAAQQIARADALTSLGNRRAFDEALEVEIARARRAESTVTVALIDLDDFKQLNRAAAARPNPGRPADLHRLNRTEYANAVRDLLGSRDRPGVDAATRRAGLRVRHQRRRAWRRARVAGSLPDRGSQDRPRRRR